MLLRLLKTVLADARVRGQRVDEAIGGIRPPLHAERAPRFLLWSEVEELAGYCRESRLVMVAALTGLRRGELFALTAEDADLSAGELVVSKTANGGSVGRRSPPAVARAPDAARCGARRGGAARAFVES